MKTEMRIDFSGLRNDTLDLQGKVVTVLGSDVESAIEKARVKNNNQPLFNIEILNRQQGTVYKGTIYIDYKGRLVLVE